MLFLGSRTTKIGFLDIFSSRIQSSIFEILDFGAGFGRNFPFKTNSKIENFEFWALNSGWKYIEKSNFSGPEAQKCNKNLEIQFFMVPVWVV